MTETTLFMDHFYILDDGRVRQFLIAGERRRTRRIIMGMDEKARLDAFEKMLHAIRENYQNTDQKMKRLKEEGKEKTATYRQLMGNKMQYQNMLSLYQIYGLTDEE